MDTFKDYLLESAQTISSKDVPKHIQTKAFKDMLMQKKANKDLVLVLHITDQGSEAELLNTKSSFEKEMLKHRLRGGAKIVEETVRDIKGVFDKINLARIHRLKPFKVGDTLISRKGEKFTVTKIEPRKIFKDGKWFPEGESIDIVGSNKGKVFTIIVR